MYSRLFILTVLPHRVHNHSAQLAAVFLGGVELPNKALKTFFCTAGLINWSLVRDAIPSLWPQKVGRVNQPFWPAVFHHEFPHWPLYSSIIFLTSVNNKGCKPCPAGFTKASKISRMAGGTSLEVSFFTSGSSPSVLTSLKANLPLP